MRDDLRKSIERKGHTGLFNSNAEIRFTYYLVSNLLDIFEETLREHWGDDPIVGMVIDSVLRKLEDDYDKAKDLLKEYGVFLPKPSRN